MFDPGRVGRIDPGGGVGQAKIMDPGGGYGMLDPGAI